MGGGRCDNEDFKLIEVGGGEMYNEDFKLIELVGEKCIMRTLS